MTSAAPHQPHPVSRAELARRAGRHRSRITAACAGPLAPATLPDGRIDAAHPAVVAWARARGIDPAQLLDRGVAPAIAPTEAVAESTRPPMPEPQPQPLMPAQLEAERADLSDPADVTDLLDYTFREIVERWGSVRGFGDWLDLRKTVAEIDRLETLNSEKRGALIERELVRVHILAMIDEAFRRLLRDASVTIPRRLYALARSGTPLEEAEVVVRETISKSLAAVKAKAQRVLREQREAA